MGMGTPFLRESDGETPLMASTPPRFLFLSILFSLFLGNNIALFLFLSFLPYPKRPVYVTCGENGPVGAFASRRKQKIGIEMQMHRLLFYIEKKILGTAASFDDGYLRKLLGYRRQVCCPFCTARWSNM